MKQNNNNRRARGRGPRKPHGMGGGHNKGQSFDSPGHETRVRGNAYQVLEKYLQLARDAGSAGDRVAAENYLQHAEHYYRVLSAMNDGQRPRIGGRELSVADVNVQNVSQGLSAALYTTGGQNMPGMGDGGSHADSQGPDRGQQHGQHGQQHGQGQHSNRGQGQHVHQGGQPRQAHQPQVQQVEAVSSPAGANGHNGGYGGYAEQPPAAYPPAAEPIRSSGNSGGDDQPDYPEELLPAAAPADAPPEPVAENPGRPARGPRGRSRGQGRRGPRMSDGGAQDGAEPGE